MKLRAEITDIARLMQAEIAAGEKAVSSAMREAGTGLKSAWRSQITGAGLGARLARTIRSEDYPKARPSLNAAALVWSKAPVIISAHDTGRSSGPAAGCGWRSRLRRPARAEAASARRRVNGRPGPG